MTTTSITTFEWAVNPRQKAKSISVFPALHLAKMEKPKNGDGDHFKLQMACIQSVGSRSVERVDLLSIKVLLLDCCTHITPHFLTVAIGRFGRARFAWNISYLTHNNKTQNELQSLSACLVLPMSTDLMRKKKHIKINFKIRTDKSYEMNRDCACATGQTHLRFENGKIRYFQNNIHFIKIINMESHAMRNARDRMWQGVRTNKL